MACYAKTFADENALNNLEAFASLNGPAHCGLPSNEETITLERRSWVAPAGIHVDGPNERAPIYRGRETLDRQVVAA
jgi:dihydroorotase